jgi:hypothetical protein
MQLKKNTNIRQALALATCTLLGTTTSQSQADETAWEIDSAVLLYSEADNRVSAIEPVVAARKEIREDEFLQLKVVLDALTGASPNGASPTDEVQTFTRPSGNGSYQTQPGDIPLDDTFKDTRAAISVSWDKPLRRLLRRTLGLGVSREFDYTSLSVNGQLSRDINNRNTTLVAGAALAADFIHPVGDIPIPLASMAPAGTPQPRDGDIENKTTLDLLFGVTQVLGHDTIGQLNYSFSNASGYLTDPFKLLSVVDGSSGKTLDVIYEHRPDSRQKHSLYGELKHFLAGDVISASYRFYSDDWGVVSHTADLRYRWNYDEHNYLQPRLRWYSQTAADFYRHSLVAGQPLPADATADPRLAEYTATTIGLKYGHRFDADSEWYLRAELYQQAGDDHPADAIGVQKSLDLFPETTAYIVQLGYRFKWERENPRSKFGRQQPTGWANSQPWPAPACFCSTAPMRPPRKH